MPYRAGLAPDLQNRRNEQGNHFRAHRLAFRFVLGYRRALRHDWDAQPEMLGFDTAA